MSPTFHKRAMHSVAQQQCLDSLQSSLSSRVTAMSSTVVAHPEHRWEGSIPRGSTWMCIHWIKSLHSSDTAIHSGKDVQTHVTSGALEYRLKACISVIPKHSRVPNHALDPCHCLPRMSLAEIRSEGFLMSIRRMRSLHSSDMVVHLGYLKLTSFSTIAFFTASREDAQKGGTPHMVTYITTPALQMSASGP